MFEPNRDFAAKKLVNFIDKNLIEYSKLRNFDFGPDQRAVSYTHLTLPTKA